MGKRSKGRAVTIVITFYTVRVFSKQRTTGINCSHKELKLATIAEIEIESVIMCTGRNQILAVHRTAEELETVILTIISLTVVESRTSTYATKGKGVQLIVLRHIGPGILHTDILDDTRIVIGIGTTISNVNSGRQIVRSDTFNALCTRLVDRSITQYDKTTPTSGSLMP